ncbi:MAG: class I SAM-dependent methyltransferase [Phycisphaerales bacterium]
MSVYRTCKGVWSRVAPQRVRRAIWIATPAPIKTLRTRALRSLERGAEHDEVYDAEYYEHIIEPAMAASAEAMSEAIVRDLAPASVIDVGCGSGGLLAALRERGVPGRGLEYAAAGIERCRGRGLEVEKFDIEADEPLGWRAEVAISTEVAEHLPASCADRFCDLLAGSADTVVLTAATPGSGGTDHVNEQPNDYWIEKFGARGFAFDRVMTDDWRRRWREAGVAGCFARTVMIFRKDEQAK